MGQFLTLGDVLGDPALRALVGRIRQLPARPRIFARLQVVLANEAVVARDVAQIITADAVITGKVLQLANSAFYRRTKPVSSIEQAVTNLGFNGVRNLVLCAEVFARWPSRSSGAVLNLEVLQEHSQRVAAVTHALAAGTSFTDDAVLAALMHDIGYWVLLQDCPGELARVQELALSERITLPEAEMRVLGASHAELGAHLLALWELPPAVVEAVAHHHAPTRVAPRPYDVLAALAVGMALSGTDDSDAFAGSPPRAIEVGPEYLAERGAPFSWGEAQQRAMRVQPSVGQA
ncbi:MAG TPA: HDOD domain-containing protein [Steroidobacteraceae bacterium]|nr:HDOD domain-containing protein [Steroidobacteraceae bacterium]